MSKYIVVDTEISDIGMLQEALADLGIEKSALKEHDQAIGLRGWGVNTKAKWVLRKEISKSMYDIGFNVEDGGVKALVESMDTSDIASKIRQGVLRQCYAKRMTRKVLEREFRRAKIKERRLKDGRIRFNLELDS